MMLTHQQLKRLRSLFSYSTSATSCLMIAILLLACDPSNPGPETTTAGNIATIAGIAGQFDYKGDGGLATKANLGYITGIAVDASGNIYFVDGAANVARRIDRSTGIISTIAGTFLGFNVNDPTPLAGDGGPAGASHLYVPMGIRTDAAGNVYIVESGNCVIRKITASSGIIITIAGKGNGSFGYAGNNGLATAAELYNPYDVAIDQSGNIYIADTQNHAIRKITASTGIITTIAGKGPGNKGYAGDNGMAIDAHLDTPQGVALDAAGNLYIVDAGNHAVRKVNMDTGVITTIAGTGDYGYAGDGGPATSARLYAPTKVAVDIAGDIYIADQGNHVIRKINVVSGIINTLAGSGTPGYSGDGGPAVAAKLFSPQGVAVDGDGNVFITESGNSVIRAVKQYP